MYDIASNLHTFGSISVRTSVSTCNSCKSSNESNVMRLYCLLNGGLFSSWIICFMWSLILAYYYKEVFVKHEQAPTAPKLEGVWVFVDLKYIFYENRYFWPNFRSGVFRPKWSKGTSTDQDLSFEPVTKSL